MRYIKYSKRYMKPLTTDIQLYTAQMDKTPIVIFIEQELVGSGVIEEVMESSIKVKGEHYAFGICEFRYAV